jgi:hypothetical protein
MKQDAGGFSMRDQIAIFVSMLLLYSVAWGQAQNSAPAPAPSNNQSMPGMDMSGSSSNGSNHDMSNMKGMNTPGQSGDKDAESDASSHVMSSMEGHMDMGPHMKMTALRAAKADDAARAQQVAEEARKAAEKYVDYHTALGEGFKIFHPEVPQKIYHFTNYSYGFEAAFKFNPEHPTSLLYEKHGDDYKLVGVMYTAPKRFTEEQLDERIPLSVAQWHEHVNFCRPPADKRAEMLAPHPQFGLRGSITTQDACDAAGGTFMPVVFNWMVHVYPFEKTQAEIWSAERQHGDKD